MTGIFKTNQRSKVRGKSLINNQARSKNVYKTQDALLRDTVPGVQTVSLQRTKQIRSAQVEPTPSYKKYSKSETDRRGKVKDLSRRKRTATSQLSNERVPSVKLPTFTVGAYVGRGGLQEGVKRTIDILGATVLLILSAPLLLLCYLLIRFDSEGPAVYDGKRVGRGGRAFPCFKFRTMHVDADKRLNTLLNNDTKLRQEYSVYRKLENDPRVTRVGSILRRTSLDELPQLFNVLRGDMSLVGPRPYLVSERRAMGESRRVILRVKPGLTGYWQVSGRSNISFAERLDMEERYARQWSLGWDIKLLFKTVLVVVKAKGAS